MSKKPTKADIQDQLDKLQAAHKTRLHELFKLEDAAKELVAEIQYYKEEAYKFHDLAKTIERQRIEEREQHGDTILTSQHTVKGLMEIMNARRPFISGENVPKFLEFRECPF